MTATTTATPSPIRVSYPALLADPAGVRADLEAALGNGAGALGVILVGGEWTEWRVELSSVTLRTRPRVVN
jgi:hypothetical protein